MGTLGVQIKVPVRLLIFGIFSRGYGLIWEGTFIKFELFQICGKSNLSKDQEIESDAQFLDELQELIANQKTSKLFTPSRGYVY